MTAELWLLFASLPLYGLYLGAQSLIFRWHYGIRYAASARDEEKPEGELLGRAERALRNFNETWLVFVILCLIGHLAMPGEAKLVRAGAGGQPVTDGPFPESKEFLAGYWIVEVDSAERAYAIAARISAAPGPGGAPLNMGVEVRQVMSAPPSTDA